MTDIVLDPSQLHAVELASHNPVAVITGGPGTGKTTVCRELLARAAAAGERFELAAPTGKAARRMSEQTGEDARTIHRLLGWTPAGWTHNPDNPINTDLVVIDEASMLDLELARLLLDAISPAARVVLIGDVDQLPSVGPGSVLRDVIASEVVPTACLTQIHRQSQDSWISVNAQRVNEGKMIHADADASLDFWWVRTETAEDTAKAVLEIVLEDAPKRLGVPVVESVQVLSPQRTGPCGVEKLNAALRDRLTPPGEDLHGFRRGDRVMHIRNNYKLGVMNGEIGVVIDTTIRGDSSTSDLVVDLDDRVVGYSKEDSADLVSAYAITIHKSQGSEFPGVVVPVHSSHSYMLSRSLLYTAITRGKRAVWLVGDRKGMDRALRNTETRRRKTLLEQRLREAMVA